MSDPPNVLFITVDQWRADCLGAVGHPVVRTPSLDGLAGEGVLFRNHFAQAAPCGPSRASIHTGLYAMNHRSVLNGTPLDARFTNVALEARAAGLDPVLFGYTDASPDPRVLDAGDPRLLTYEGVLPGYRAVVDLPEHLRPWGEWLRTRGYDVPDDVRTLYEPVGPEPGAPARYSAGDSEAAFLTDEILRYLDAADRRPFFVHAAYIRPHPPFVAPAPYHALYDPTAVPAPRRRPDPEAEGAVHPLLAGAISVTSQLTDVSDECIGHLAAAYFGMMTEVDAQLGRLFDGLRHRGLWDSTFVIVTSDHGEQLGDHWLSEKLGWFDESYHIPLIVRDPSSASDSTRGAQLDEFTENVDLMPTLLEAIGAPVPAQCDGASLLLLVRSGTAPPGWRDAVHWEWDFRDPVARVPQKALGVSIDECSLAVLRDHAGKYVHFAAPSLPPLFYDLVDDPDEMVDRAGDPEYAETVLHYAQRMLSWRLTHADRTVSGLLVTPQGVIDGRRTRRVTAPASPPA